MRISDWSSDVCSSDLSSDLWKTGPLGKAGQHPYNPPNPLQRSGMRILFITANRLGDAILSTGLLHELHQRFPKARFTVRSEEHTSELQSLMRISYAVFCLKKKKQNKKHDHTTILKNIHTEHKQ